MGLERRGNGYYYYKKEREGKQVFSRYVGTGSGIADLYSILSDLDAEQREFDRFERRWEREKAERFEAELSEIEETFNNLITAFLLINGYHQSSSREWRKKRNGKN